MKPRVFPLALAALLVAHAADAAVTECLPRSGLPNVFLRLERGETVRIAYLGGSITAQEGWRPQSLQWFRQQFPAATVREINAAIGGTGSELGVFRLRHDVLDARPDLLFVEFAVNDGGTPAAHIHRCMEGIVRQDRYGFGMDDSNVPPLAGVVTQEHKPGEQQKKENDRAPSGLGRCPQHSKH